MKALKQLTIDGNSSPDANNCNYIQSQLKSIEAAQSIEELIEYLTKDRPQPSKRWLKESIRKTFKETALRACKTKAMQSIINSFKPIDK